MMQRASSRLRVRWERLAKGINHFDEPWRQPIPDGTDNGLGHTSVERLSDASSDRGLRVGITAERYGGLIAPTLRNPRTPRSLRDGPWHDTSH
jgi:hypothetical protein